MEITDYAGMWAKYFVNRRHDLSAVTEQTRSITIDINDVARAGLD